MAPVWETTSDKQVTQLYRACYAGDESRVQELLRAEVDIEARADFCKHWVESRPINYACRWGNAAVVKALLQAGAKPTQIPGCTACVEDTPFYWACQSGRVDIVKLLLEAGLALNGAVLLTMTGQAEDRPLHLAALAGCAETCEFLLSAGAEVDAVGRANETPLIAACRGAAYGRHMDGRFLFESPQHDKVAQTLLLAGASAPAVSAIGETPLHFARGLNEKTCKMLLARGADVNAQSLEGKMPLHRAGFAGTACVARKLLEAGADTEARDAKFQTPLHIAARYGNKDFVQALLAAGADVEAQDNDGARALHRACEAWNDEGDPSLQVLLAAGAKVNVCDKRGRTPLTIAIQQKNVANIRRLAAAGAKAPKASDDTEASLLKMAQAWQAELDAKERSQQLFVAIALEARHLRRRIR